MAEDEFGSSIEVLAATPEKVGVLLQGLSHEQLRLKPEADGFSLKEYLLQFRDLELESYRPAIRSILAETLPSLVDLDLARLTTLRQYQLADGPMALESFRQARQGNLAYLRNMTGFQWNRKALLGGVEVTLLQLVIQWASHDRTALRDMEQLAATATRSTE